MLPHKRQHKKYKHIAGYATVISVLILSAVVSAILLATFTDIKSQQQNAREAYYSARAAEAAEAGIAYALFRINKDQFVVTLVTPVTLTPPANFPSSSSFSVTLSSLNIINTSIQIDSTGTTQNSSPTYTKQAQVKIAPTTAPVTSGICVPGTSRCVQNCRPPCRALCIASGGGNGACNQYCQTICNDCCAGSGGGSSSTKIYAIIPGSWRDFTPN